MKAHVDTSTNMECLKRYHYIGNLNKESVKAQTPERMRQICAELREAEYTGDSISDSIRAALHEKNFSQAEICQEYYDPDTWWKSFDNGVCFYADEFCAAGNDEAIKWMVEKYTNAENDALLRSALKHKRYDLAKYILEHTPTEITSKWENPTFVLMEDPEKGLELVEMMANAGCFNNMASSVNRIMFMEAASTGRKDVVNRLEEIIGKMETGCSAANNHNAEIAESAISTGNWEFAEWVMKKLKTTMKRVINRKELILLKLLKLSDDQIRELLNLCDTFHAGSNLLDIALMNDDGRAARVITEHLGLDEDSVPNRALVYILHGSQGLIDWAFDSFRFRTDEHLEKIAQVIDFALEEENSVETVEKIMCRTIEHAPDAISRMQGMVIKLLAEESCAMGIQNIKWVFDRFKISRDDMEKQKWKPVKNLIMVIPQTREAISWLLAEYNPKFSARDVNDIYRCMMRPRVGGPLINPELLEILHSAGLTPTKPEKLMENHGYSEPWALEWVMEKFGLPKNFGPLTVEAINEIPSHPDPATIEWLLNHTEPTANDALLMPAIKREDNLLVAAMFAARFEKLTGDKQRYAEFRKACKEEDYKNAARIAKRLAKPGKK